jgi:hypothetical protein
MSMRAASFTRGNAGFVRRPAYFPEEKPGLQGDSQVSMEGSQFSKEDTLLSRGKARSPRGHTAFQGEKPVFQGGPPVFQKESQVSKGGARKFASKLKFKIFKTTRRLRTEEFKKKSLNFW